MKAFIVNWLKIKFTQNNGSVWVRTASCQNGVLHARTEAACPQDIEVVSSAWPNPTDPTVHLQEDIIYLNRREASFINKQVRQLLKTKQAESARRKRAGIPPPPAPGKIAYAVYQ